jgi:glycerate 2-kinase
VRCAIAGGETTVTVRGVGKGGRNQELALAAAPQLLGLRHALLLTFGTDGVDGPTDAAGAVVDANTIARAIELGRDPATHLADNDAYPFFAALDDLLRPGPTGTNVADLALLFS